MATSKLTEKSKQRSYSANRSILSENKHSILNGNRTQYQKSVMRISATNMINNKNPLKANEINTKNQDQDLVKDQQYSASIVENQRTLSKPTQDNNK